MAKFSIGKPQTTNVPTISVDGGSLPVGIHRFRLEVIGKSGVPSAADEVLIQVVSGTTIPSRSVTAPVAKPASTIAAPPTPRTTPSTKMSKSRSKT